MPLRTWRSPARHNIGPQARTSWARRARLRGPTRHTLRPRGGGTEAGGSARFCGCGLRAFQMLAHWTWRRNTCGLPSWVSNSSSCSGSDVRIGRSQPSHGLPEPNPAHVRDASPIGKTRRASLSRIRSCAICMMPTRAGTAAMPLDHQCSPTICNHEIFRPIYIHERDPELIDTCHLSGLRTKAWIESIKCGCRSLATIKVSLEHRRSPSRILSRMATPPTSSRTSRSHPGDIAPVRRLSRCPDRPKIPFDRI
jgi:hypothetical protein